MLNITEEQQTRLMGYLNTVPKAGFGDIAETLEFCNIVAIINSPERELAEIQRANLLIFLDKASITGREAGRLCELKKVIADMPIKRNEVLK
jgi:hypothetical protein